MSLTFQNRSKKGRRSKLDPASDHLIDLIEVAHRWNLSSPGARGRLEKAGVPMLKFNTKSLQVWLSDIEALEAKCTFSGSSPP
jgi:hypothetical protein